MDRCLACDLASGRTALPGGTIAKDAGWVVEHCVGPLGVGTLVVKPERHVVHVADLTGEEAAVMGRVLHQAARVVTEVLNPDQVYISLWSHADRRPGHIHYVVQPVDQAAMARHDAHGPKLQASMFESDDLPDPLAVEEFASPSARALEDGAASKPILRRFHRWRGQSGGTGRLVRRLWLRVRNVLPAGDR